MKQLIILLFGVFTFISISAQSLRKYSISGSGCSAYFFCDPGEFKLEKSPDSSDVYTGECINDSVTYGAICVKLSVKLPDLETSEGTLISYLDYLKSTMKIKSAAGYGKGHRLKNNEATRGVIDYWRDADGGNWKIKGWTDGKYIVVMYVSSVKEISESKTNIFLDGLVLPGN